MMFGRFDIKKRVCTLFADRQGNFAMMTAIALPMLMGVAGAGLEFTKAMQVKSDLQSAADAATLNAATQFRQSEGEKSDEELKANVVQFLAGQEFAQEMSQAELKKLEGEVNSVTNRTETSKGTTFKISTTINHQMPLNPLLGLVWAKTLTISATSTAESSVNNGSPLSMYLVLDRSGSMAFKTDTVDKSRYSCDNYDKGSWPYPMNSTTPCYVDKITSLKTAVRFLVDTLNTSDPTFKSAGSPQSSLVRTSAVAYNDKASSTPGLDWGTKSSVSYVNALSATGGTDASGALNAAFEALKSSNAAESDAHMRAGNKSFQRIIVLMTDGEMTGNSANWSSSVDNAVRNTCARAKTDDIKIYTVAFMAPDRGKSLLKACATSIDNYYAPENMEGIVAAFGDIARKAAGNVSRLTN